MIGALVKGAVLQKVVREARKPQNQQRAKDAFSKLTNKGGGRGGSAGR